MLMVIPLCLSHLGVYDVSLGFIATLEQYSLVFIPLIHDCKAVLPHSRNLTMHRCWHILSFIYIHLTLLSTIQL